MTLVAIALSLLIPAAMVTRAVRLWSDWMEDSVDPSSATTNPDILQPLSPAEGLASHEPRTGSSDAQEPRPSARWVRAAWTCGLDDVWVLVAAPAVAAVFWAIVVTKVITKWHFFGDAAALGGAVELSVPPVLVVGRNMSVALQVLSVLVFCAQTGIAIHALAVGFLFPEVGGAFYAATWVLQGAILLAARVRCARGAGGTDRDDAATASLVAPLGGALSTALIIQSWYALDSAADTSKFATCLAIYAALQHVWYLRLLPLPPRRTTPAPAGAAVCARCVRVPCPMWCAEHACCAAGRASTSPAVVAARRVFVVSRDDV
jgi:hypothetical protein